MNESYQEFEAKREKNELNRICMGFLYANFMKKVIQANKNEDEEEEENWL